jgi:2-amino-4-hydroxy-6-hydroxymethyldihydropteridine diphosphokinase
LFTTKSSLRTVGLGLGGNLGDAASNVRRAVQMLREAGTTIDAVSSLYLSKAWGVTDQPDFINACALARTALEPLALLDLVQKTEKAIGRQPTYRWGPRTIDIDVLFYENLRCHDQRLILPHESIFARAFVLLPLAEIDADRVIEGRKIGEAAEKVERDGVIRMADFW